MNITFKRKSRLLFIILNERRYIKKKTKVDVGKAIGYVVSTFFWNTLGNIPNKMDKQS